MLIGLVNSRLLSKIDNNGKSTINYEYLGENTIKDFWNQVNKPRKGVRWKWILIFYFIAFTLRSY